MKKISILCMLLICSIAFSQEKEDKKDSDINPFRIGVKIGIPNIVGVDVEYVTPLFDNRFALFVDYSAFKVSPDQAEVKIKHIEFGTNIYFNNKGRGLYGSVSYSNLSLDGSYTNAETVNGTVYDGIATGVVDIKTTNLKIGAKLGKKFYFRIEAGYGFGDMPKVVEVTGQSGSVTETDFVEIPDIPGISDNGLFIGNIGFGISF
ncbi:MAG: hypothetical protein L3J14_09535 [Flavobacteriaceae bacterium]|nr:hypothetical protein [Flavobacteriaceae bacterium]